MLSAGACGAACLAADGENTEQPRIERRVFRTSVTTGSPLQNPELAYYVVLTHTVAYWVATVSDTTRCDLATRGQRRTQCAPAKVTPARGRPRHKCRARPRRVAMAFPLPERAATAGCAPARHYPRVEHCGPRPQRRTGNHGFGVAHGGPQTGNDTSHRRSTAALVRAFTYHRQGAPSTPRL